jgi:hypothetical protein
MVITSVLAEHGEIGGRGFNALLAMQQAEAIVKALERAGYEIRRRTSIAMAESPRRLPAPWHADPMPGGKCIDLYINHVCSLAPNLTGNPARRRCRPASRCLSS